MNDPQYPRGKIHPEDEGELDIRVGVDSKTQTVIVDFGKPILWVGFSAEHARSIAATLIRCADSIKELEAKAKGEA